jgi:hypothetical protein
LNVDWNAALEIFGILMLFDLRMSECGRILCVRGDEIFADFRHLEESSQLATLLDFLFLKFDFLFNVVVATDWIIRQDSCLLIHKV